MAKFSWKEVGSGFKSILSRNALLIMGFYILNMYSTYFKNGFRSLLVLTRWDWHQRCWAFLSRSS